MKRLLYTNCILVSFEYVRRYDNCKVCYEPKIRYWLSYRVVKAYWERNSLLSLLVGHFYVRRTDGCEIHFTSVGKERCALFKKIGALNYVWVRETNKGKLI
jgi:hypothetical protein